MPLDKTKLDEIARRMHEGVMRRLSHSKLAADRFALPVDQIGQHAKEEIVEFQLGLYKHYKGGEYFAVGLGTHHETRKPMVSYVSREKRTWNNRPLEGRSDDPDGWLTPASIQDVGGWWDTVPRFVFVRPLVEEDCKEIDAIFVELGLPFRMVLPKAGG